MSTYTFTNSTLHSETPQANETFFLCNSLEVKRKYIYFRRGPIGTPGYPCGTEKFKMKMEGVTHQQTTQTCTNGKPIWRVTYN
jgi:hypothetical protein